MKVKDMIEKLKTFDGNLNLILVCEECRHEYDYFSVEQVYFKIHKDLDDVPIQLLLNINKNMR